ncbi:hypothetical protein BKA69DRAFT_1042795 [Paraphysoderma sedebokerense]|nr:hypothetical protein BKA69DRAFT_1042795 [Paraphysoderma sedebokerense]
MYSIPDPASFFILFLRWKRRFYQIRLSGKIFKDGTAFQVACHLAAHYLPLSDQEANGEMNRTELLEAFISCFNLLHMYQFYQPSFDRHINENDNELQNNRIDGDENNPSHGSKYVDGRINQDDSQLQRNQTDGDENNHSHGSKYAALIEQIRLVRREYISAADSDERLQQTLDELLAEKHQLDDVLGNHGN